MGNYGKAGFSEIGPSPNGAIDCREGGTAASQPEGGRYQSFEWRLNWNRTQLGCWHYVRWLRHGRSLFSRFGYHFHDNASGFLRIVYFPQESDPRATRAIRGFEANVKAEPVNGCHRNFLRLNSSERVGQFDERAPVVGIHVLDDPCCRIDQRVGLGEVIFRGGNPTHHPEATH